MTNDTASMPLIKHLEELRGRLLRFAWAYVALFSVCAYYARSIFDFLQKPLQARLAPGSFFIATTAASGWLVYLRVAMIVSLFLSFPFLIFELWNFTSPGLKKHERRYLWPLTLLITVFFFSGVAFAYALVLPWSLTFLATVYEGTNIRFLPQIDDYLSFVTATLLGFGIIFELPFLVLFLTQSGLVSAATLRKFRPYIYVFAFIVGAILTPPDVASQVMMSVPFCLLFELGLLFGKIFRWKTPDSK
jgi:sec-independent protein translocase protein TatC